MPIVAATFPVMHQLLTTCIQFESIEAALVIKAVTKIYFSCIQVGIQPFSSLYFPPTLLFEQRVAQSLTEVLFCIWR